MSPGTSPSVDPGSLVPGTHLCAFHRDDEQLARIAGTFVGHGLSAGDQLLYVATDTQAQSLLTGSPAASTPRPSWRPAS